MADLGSITLAFGAHASRADGMCLLEAVAYVAGEPHTDRPQCVCPVLAAFGRTWNDALEHADRNRLLKPFIPLLIGTRSTPEVDQKRGYMAADWLVRMYAPVWLRAAGVAFEAAELEALPPLDSAAACRDARLTIAQVREAAFAARNPAWEAARPAAMATARNAAKAAARASARAAAADAASAGGAWDASTDAATDAAWASARNAAVVVAAAGGALRPYVEQLQASAVDLYERMIEVTA